MQTAQTIARIRGGAIAGMLFTSFGAVWFILGFYVQPQLSAAARCWIAGAILWLSALVAFAHSAFALRRASARVPSQAA